MPSPRAPSTGTHLMWPKNEDVAQPVRVLACHAKGHVFEPRHSRCFHG